MLTGDPIPSGRPLVATTWLSPGLPLGLFQTIAEHLGDALGLPTELTAESKISGPLKPEDDRFAMGLTDVGFLCPPPYVWLRRPPNDSVRLVPMAPVYDDPRNDGRPVYFSDIVVRVDAPFERFDDLSGARFGYNDPSSLSGYLSVLGRLAERSIDALGPHPVQPVVVRTGLADSLLGPIRAALSDPSLIDRVRRYGVVGFAPNSDGDFDMIAANTRLVAGSADSVPGLCHDPGAQSPNNRSRVWATPSA